MELRGRLSSLWANLSLIPGVSRQARHHISIQLHNRTCKVPLDAPRLFSVGGFSMFQDGESFYLTDNASVFHLRLASSQGDAFLAPSFFQLPELVQYNFWSFGLLKLLRPLKFYSLHAAGLVSPEGEGMLVTGPSGSGKSTLALGLIRHGWGYLSDDAILLRPLSDSIHALALRDHFYLDASAAVRNRDLPLGRAVPDNDGGQRRRILLEETPFGGQRIKECSPRLLLFSRIVHEESSSVIPLGPGKALKHLLEASGPQLFDRVTMEQHLEVLKLLLKQTMSFELRAGLDVYRDPMTLVRLLGRVKRKEATWLVSSSN
jgi:hypothetical protein